MGGCKGVSVVWLVLVVWLVVSPQTNVKALTCGQVVSSVSPCIGYLTGGELSKSCCPGIQSLNAAAKTTADRQKACNCLKAAAASIKGFNYELAAGLPGKCGVSLPYKISPSIDCSKVK